MAAFSNYLENELLDHVLRGATAGTAYAQPAAVYVALFTGTATAAELEAGTITNEVTGGSYARQAVTFDAPVGGATANSAAVSFTSMPAVTVAFAAVMDATTAGNVLFYGALTASKTLNAGDTFTINTGDLDISVD